MAIGYIMPHSRYIKEPGLKAVLAEATVVDIQDISSPEVSCTGDQRESYLFCSRYLIGTCHSGEKAIGLTGSVD